jgi:polysaccharide biosynthesis protein PslG
MTAHLMRKAKRISVVVMASAMTVGLISAAPATAATFVDGTQFGLHVPRISNGVVPTVPYGTVRLWDSGVTWGQVEQSRGKYWWVGFDQAVAAAKNQNAQILYVLGSTPRWAASNKSLGTYPNKGAASNPRYLADWRRWVTKVVTRYGDSIDAYQIWNEANLATFWQGTPRQMAILTKEAYKIIRRLDPTAQVVAASTSVRLASAFNRFYPAYLIQLRRLNWPVNVFAIHSYGPSTATPAVRAKYIKKTRKALKEARAPKRPLWDTEVNYGIAGPGLKYPDKDINGWKASAYTSQTYLDSLRLGVARTYWYAWMPQTDLLGITMFNGTLAATAYQTTYDWVIGATVACSSSPLRVCYVDKGGVPSQIVWRSAGVPIPYTVPIYATRSCSAAGSCQPVAPGSTVMIGRMPMWFGIG